MSGNGIKVEFYLFYLFNICTFLNRSFEKQSCYNGIWLAMFIDLTYS